MDSPQDALPQSPANAGEVERVREVAEYAGDVRWRELGEGSPFTLVDRRMLAELYTKARSVGVRAALSTPSAQSGDGQAEANAATALFSRFKKEGAFDICADVVGVGRVTIRVGQCTPDTSKEGADVREARRIAASFWRDYPRASSSHEAFASDIERGLKDDCEAVQVAILALRASQPPEQAGIVLRPLEEARRDGTWMLGWFKRGWAVRPIPIHWAEDPPYCGWFQVCGATGLSEADMDGFLGWETISERSVRAAFTAAQAGIAK